MTKFRVAVVILVFAVAIWVLGRKNSGQGDSHGPPVVPDNSSAIPTANGVAGNPVPQSVAPGTTPTDLASRAGSPSSTSPTNGAPNLPGLTILDNVRVAIHNYNERFGENPIGTNPEITAALMGKNPKQINFISGESGLRVNENGEMVDAYGTPFFFHQVSAREMEIRSAGPDRMMWTIDDLVTR